MVSLVNRTELEGDRPSIDDIYINGIIQYLSISEEWAVRI